MSQIFYLGPGFCFMKSRKLSPKNVQKVSRFLTLFGHSSNPFGGNCVSDFYLCLSFYFMPKIAKRKKLFCKSHEITTRAQIKNLRHGSLHYNIKNKHTKFEKSRININ